MRQGATVLWGLLMILLVTSVSAAELIPRPIPDKPISAVIPVGFDNRHVEVKFVDGLDIGLNAAGVPYDRSAATMQSSDAVAVMQTIANEGGDWMRMSQLDETEMDRLRDNAQETMGREISDINNYFILTVRDGVDAVEWINQLNSLAEVEIAQAMPLPTPLPRMPGDFQPLQGYLNPAPLGIDALGCWGMPGGTGWCNPSAPIKVCDFEYSWNLSHADLGSVSLQFPPGMTPSDPYLNDDHGTAVVGVMRSMSNLWGTSGAAYGTQFYVAPTYLNSAWQLGVQLSWMMGIFGPGDVFLIEHQFVGPNWPGGSTQVGMIPVEWWQSWYNVIVTAVGNGIHVVEAAGNGYQDLDLPIYSTGNGGHWPFLPVNHSGAIIVGAGAAPASFGGTDIDRSRLAFSNWGSRLDLQGWGEAVVTSGYGDLHSVDGRNYLYTSMFAGTSSASPVVASAVALLEAVYEEGHGLAPLTPWTVRTALIATGSPQQNGTYPVTQHIGPRPDLMAAIASIPTSCCIGQRGDVDGDGVDADPVDLSYLVDYLFNAGPGSACADEADLNGDGLSADPVDLSYLVDFLFNAGPSPLPC